MMQMRHILLAISVLSVASSAWASAGIGVVSGRGGIFYGGSVSAGVGSVDYVELSPMIGTHLTQRVSAGVSLLYRYRREKRSGREFTSNDYGMALFARYRVARSFYLETDYEYLDHEFARSESGTTRRQYHSFLAGGGVTTPLSANSVMYLSVLYNLNHDESGTPYGDPWVVRFGIGVGF